MTRPNAPESNVPNTIEQDFGGTRLIHLSGTLRAKAAVRNSDASGVDDLSIAAAESAMKDLSGDFQNWMGDEVNRLVAAFDEYRSNGPGERDISNLFRAAHDIRGQASAFGYPLAAEIAGSLAKLLDKIEPDYLPVQLITHHVDAVRAVYRSQIRDYANPIAVQIIHNLNKAIDRVVEARVKALAEEQKIALGR
ncbi:MAG: Hpt domain-containing protein [Methylobacterium sp.]|nr:Hpt domain-containing protein [Methylobacterium sp.]MCA3627630.1 Hpt domain-containing protein [Methylobacterium sp.]